MWFTKKRKQSSKRKQIKLKLTSWTKHLQYFFGKRYWILCSTVAEADACCRSIVHTIKMRKLLESYSVFIDGYYVMMMAIIAAFNKNCLLSIIWLVTIGYLCLFSLPYGVWIAMFFISRCSMFNGPNQFLVSSFPPVWAWNVIVARFLSQLLVTMWFFGPLFSTI